VYGDPRQTFATALLTEDSQGSRLLPASFETLSDLF
jgi:hypothetical protein